MYACRPIVALGEREQSVVSSRHMSLVIAGLVALAGIGATAYAKLSAPVPASLDVTGVMGPLGEWEITATLTRVGDTRDFTGPMKVKHIGFCSQSGALVKSGELRIAMARLSSSITAKVFVDEVTCDYAGHLSDAYTGALSCPERPPVRMLLRVR
jgi:hypothetical protein